MNNSKKIVSENIIYPVNLVSYAENNIWSIYSTSQVDQNKNQGYIMAKNISDDSKPVLVTKNPGNYGSIKAVSNGNMVSIVYTEYNNREKCILLSSIKDGKVYGPEIITGFGKYDNPEVCLHDKFLWIAWESYQSGKSEIMCRPLNIESLTQMENKVSFASNAEIITSQQEKAYKPSMISDGDCLYLVYECFFENRYHIMVRCLSNKEKVFSSPFEVGFSDNNDQAATVSLHDGKVLIAWENSSPLYKGYTWLDHLENEIIMPGFGHGWKVSTRIGLRRISYKNEGLTIEDLCSIENNSPSVHIDSQESSGCPRVFTNSEGRIFIAYLAWSENPYRGWKIKVKFLSGTEWVEAGETGLIQKQRVHPAIFMDNTNTKIYILGNKGDYESKYWTYENNSTWCEVIELSDECCHVPYSFNSKPVPYTEIIAENESSHHTIEYNGKKLGLFWGDLHMHTNLSRCSLHDKFHCTEIDEKYRFCRDVANLDFAMITDHDSMSEYEWNITCDTAHFNNLPENFTAFAGFEWTCTQYKDKPNYGHYNVLYKDTGSLYKTSDAVFGNIQNLWDVLQKGKALTIPHHPGCNTHPLDWNYFNGDFVPLVEIFQVRGSYEYDQCPMYPTNYGREVTNNNSVQDGLNRGYKFGFTSGGEHEGVGVTAIFAESLTRDAIFEALQKRHVYGTTGDHIFIDFRLNGHLMGSEVRTKNSNPKIEVKVAGTSNIESVKVVRNGNIIKEWNPNKKEVTLEWVDDSLSQVDQHSNYYYYVVVNQDNNEMAWASPVFLILD